MCEVVLFGVEIGAGDEGVLEGSTGGLLEVGVSEVLLFDSLLVLMGEIDAGDAFVVGGESPGNVCVAIESQKVAGRP